MLTVSCNGSVVQLHAGSEPIYIGRGTACAVRVDDLMVSSRHLKVWWESGTWQLEDIGSVNGSFVGVNQVQRLNLSAVTELRLGDPVVGPVVRFEPVFAAATAPAPVVAAPIAAAPVAAAPVAAALAVPPPPVAFVPSATPADPPPAPLGTEVVFGVYELTVETAGVRRLDRLSFSLRRGQMLGVLGGSGAGKSTLLKAITGSDPASSGTVLFENRDLYRDFEHVRQRVGYVPQDDILHPSLSVRTTLDFGAMLRMPEASAADRDARVRAVVDELGLTHRFDAKVTELSGGQRKRLNVALELLSRPPLLILDEPTSGLDPANERSLMQLLRKLADGGRTVIVVTHSTESLHLCNDVLFLARGGLPAYLGPPQAMAASLGASSLIDAFGFVDNHPNPSELRAAFDRQHHQVVAPAALPSPAPPPALPWQRQLAVDADRVGRDFWILLRRSVAVLQGDRRNAIIIGAQGPVIALVMLVVFGEGKLDPSNGVSSGASSVLLAMVLAVVFVGAAGSVREIVKERPILLREQAVGVSTAAYVAAKVLLQGALVVVQSVIIVVFTMARQGGPEDGFLPFGATAEVIIAVALTGVGAVSLGLLISAAVTSADKAMTLLPVALFLQLLLAGVIVPVDTFGIQQLSWLVGSQWGLNGVGSVNDLWNMRGCGLLPPPGSEAPSCNTMWQQETSNWVVAVFMLSVLFLAATYGTFKMLRRRDPVVVLAAKASA